MMRSRARLQPVARLAERGRTLIELVIAMAISLVIIGAVASLYFSSSKVSRMASQVGSVEEGARLAMFFIGDAIKLAGYGEIVGSDWAARGQTMFDGAHIRGCVGRPFTDPFASPPDLTCDLGKTVPGDVLYVRFQAGPEIAQVSAAEQANLTMPDCAGDSNANQDEMIELTSAHVKAGVQRMMVTNVFGLNAAGTSLNCQGNGGGGNQPLVGNVKHFKVFFRFDDAGFEAAKYGVTNAAPLGGSVRDATFLNAQASTVTNAWDYVTAVMVCMTVETDELGISDDSTNTKATRCPTTEKEAEEGKGDLVETTTTGKVQRTYAHVFTVRSRATASPALTL
jgi:Tfp pilus assembly protein PilW